MGIGLGQSYDIEGNPISVDVASAYATGQTGAVQGYCEITKDPKTGAVISERWVGETPDEAAARLASRGVVQRAAVERGVDGGIMDILTSMQEQLEAQSKELADLRAYRAAGVNAKTPPRRTKPKPKVAPAPSTEEGA